MAGGDVFSIGVDCEISPIIKIHIHFFLNEFPESFYSD